MRERQNNNRRRTDNFTIDEDLLKIARICLSVFFVFIGFGLLATKNDLGLYDPDWIRQLHSVFMFSVLAATYLSNWVRLKIQTIMNFLFYTMSIHSFLLLYWNGLYIGYLIGMVLVITCIGVSFVQKRWLIYYLFFTILASILVGIFTTNPQVDLYLYYPTIITPALVSYLTLNVRLNAIQKLSESELKLQNYYSRMSEELAMAQETQKALVALEFPEGKQYKMYSYYRAYEGVGGDVLSVEERSDGKLNILFADVSGHGIASAMVSAMAILAFKIVSKSNLKPAESLRTMHELMKPLVANLHISASLLVFDPDNLVVEYSYAGHPCILLLRDGEVSELEGRGNLILTFMEPTLRDYQKNLQQGDRLIFYSDGLVELFNLSDDIYGDESFFQSVKNNRNRYGREFLEFLVMESLMFSNGKVSDDMTLLSLEILG
ncbi:PP2C family protein-serine/threonine phosphatase [Leptospira sp. GIMC2001]|uniref:PP2C family protein-serine/threonine phosphatase n=1 Tax=Leptospira sp. GIMC2001 TaxID=1513297 RepID=UPI00234A5275|nr:PP2C family protein-serine/threonine phosphatase [Leptospira sp. GIMC2001]WCL49132.1 PP2C family protein-serine/threonine phosphatase [Leptospira sp. GIMC2001]